MSSPGSKITRDNNFLPEIVLTLIGFYLVVLLYGKLLSHYALYLTIGLALGFTFQWFNKKVPLILVNVLVSVFTVVIFSLTVYFILNSTFRYKEIFLICLKGAFLLQIVLSFSPVFVSSIQILNIPIFMGSFLFIEQFEIKHLILVLGFFACWSFILRIKFYTAFKSYSAKKIRQHSHVFFFIVFYLICLYVSWTLFSSISLSKMKKSGILPEQSLFDEEEQEKLEKEYYDLQDKIQKDISEAALKFKEAKDGNKMITALSSIVKEASDVMEVEKAQEGLVSLLREPGPGLETTTDEDITASMHNYIDRKVVHNLKKGKDSMVDGLRSQPLNVIDRILALSSLGRMRFSNSGEQIRDSAKDLKNAIGKSSLKPDIKEEFEDNIDEFKDWKEFGVYRKKLNSLRKKIAVYKDDIADQFQNLPQEITRAENLSDLKKVEDKADGLKEIPSENINELLNDISDILDLKLDMLLSKEAKTLKEKIDNIEMPDYTKDKLKVSLLAIGDKLEIDKKNDLNKFEKDIDDNVRDLKKISNELKAYLEIKVYDILKEKLRSIEEILKKSTSEYAGKELVNKLKKLTQELDEDKISSTVDELNEKVFELASQGAILEAQKNAVTKELEEAKNVLLLKVRINKSLNSEEISGKVRKISYSNNLSKIVESLNIPKDKKYTLKQLVEELLRAETISGIEDIKVVFNKELDKLVVEDKEKEKIEKLKESYENTASLKEMLIIEETRYSLLNKLEELKKVSPEVSSKIVECVEKIEAWSSSKELRKITDMIAEYIHELENEEKGQNIKEGGAWQIIVLPDRLIVPKGYSVPLRVFGIFNKAVIKELKDQDLVWYSSNPQVAFANEEGLVRSQGKGEAKIGVVFKDRYIKEVNIFVVDDVSKEIEDTLRKELAK